MNRILHGRLSVLGFTMTMPLIAVIWAVAAPGAMPGLTLMALVVIAIGTAVVIFNTWRNAQPGELMGPVLRRAAIPPTAAAFARPVGGRRAPDGCVRP